MSTVQSGGLAADTGQTGGEKSFSGEAAPFRPRWWFWPALAIIVAAPAGGRRTTAWWESRQAYAWQSGWQAGFVAGRDAHEISARKWIVSGAGDTSCNGTYNPGGFDHWGHPYWIKTNGMILFQDTAGSGQFALYSAPGPVREGCAAYYTAGTSLTGIWSVGQLGTGPAPTVAATPAGQ